MSELSGTAASLVGNATKKLREEGEIISKNRLLDQQFHPSRFFFPSSSLVCPRRMSLVALTGAIRLCEGRYADPLVPRKTPDPRFWPKDVTPEMEQRWLAMIKESRSV